MTIFRVNETAASGSGKLSVLGERGMAVWVSFSVSDTGFSAANHKVSASATAPSSGPSLLPTSLKSDCSAHDHCCNITSDIDQVN